VEDVGEGTGLLSEGKEREAKREKLAKVALNGRSLWVTPHLTTWALHQDRTGGSALADT
jgi:hypothetical protein